MLRLEVRVRGRRRTCRRYLPDDEQRRTDQMVPYLHGSLDLLHVSLREFVFRTSWNRDVRAISAMIFPIFLFIPFMRNQKTPGSSAHTPYGCLDWIIPLEPDNLSQNLIPQFGDQLRLVFQAPGPERGSLNPEAQEGPQVHRRDRIPFKFPFSVYTWGDHDHAPLSKANIVILPSTACESKFFFQCV